MRTGRVTESGPPHSVRVRLASALSLLEDRVSSTMVPMTSHADVPFPPNNENRCRIVHVIDGDTVVAQLDVGYEIETKKHIRLLGDWAPETKDLKGPAATAFVQEWVDARQPSGVQWPLLVRCKGRRSWERWLGNILDADSNDLSAAVVAAGHGTTTKG